MNEHAQAAPAANTPAPAQAASAPQHPNPAPLAERLRAGLLLALEHAPAEERPALRATLADLEADAARKQEWDSRMQHKLREIGFILEDAADLMERVRDDYLIVAVELLKEEGEA